ncbi:hypothetical protein HDR59_01505 [bacterium]|nr:hypothetical protein [bacterium]
MNKKNIFILTIPIAMFTISNAKASPFTNALSDYCVPTTATYCTGPFKATYENNTCKCKNTTYLKYNPTERHCEIQCPAGSMPELTSSCPGGYMKLFIAE